MWPSGFSCKGRAAAHLASREEVAAQSWLPSPYTPQDPQPGSLPWCGWREEEEGRKEGEQELAAVGLSLAMNSCLGAGHGAQGQQSPCQGCWGWGWLWPWAAQGGDAPKRDLCFLPRALFSCHYLKYLNWRNDFPNTKFLWRTAQLFQKNFWGGKVHTHKVCQGEPLVTFTKYDSKIPASFNTGI